jgi:hypothetical protein
MYDDVVDADCGSTHVVSDDKHKHNDNQHYIANDNCIIIMEGTNDVELSELINLKL